MTTYIEDDEGKFIPATQRPDGTWRKARRVKDGYVPQEEVPLYESKGKQYAKKPDLPVGMCLKVVQQIKDKKCSKNKDNQNTVNRKQLPELVITNKQPGMNNKLTSQPTTSSITTNLQQTVKNNTIKLNTKCNTNNNVNNIKKQNIKKIGVKKVTKIETVVDIHLDPQSEHNKKIKKLKKKLREIGAIEIKLNSGEIKSLGKDQEDKVGRKTEIINELSLLEQLTI